MGKRLCFSRAHFHDMLKLFLQANPQEIVVGWYATSSRMTLFSAIIQNYFANNTLPQPAIHLTLNCEPDTETPFVMNAYTHTGIGRKSDGNCLFIPLEATIKYDQDDQSALYSLMPEQEKSTHKSIIPSDLRVFSDSLKGAVAMIERVKLYIDKVLAGDIDYTSPEIKAIGRYLMDTLSAIPRLDKTELENMFNTHLQDILMVVYLSNAIRSQFEVNQRLAMVV